MGAQSYQENIAARASDAMAAASSDRWDLKRMIVRSLRSTLPGNRRLPMSVVAAASPAVRRSIGRMLYQRSTVTHRMNLELPPDPRADVVTLHDVVAWRFPDESAPVPAAAEELRRARAVICVSEFSAGEAVALLGITDPHVIYNGVDERFFDADPLGSGDATSLALPPRYLLHAGGAALRKNLEALADAWPRVLAERPGLCLVLAGPDHPRRTALFGRLPGTLLLGRVSDELMPGLVAGAEAVVVPSLYEGFGLPVLEAMAASVPVVAARTSSLPEVAGDSAFLTDPTGVGIAEGILNATSSDSAVAQLVRAGRARAAEFSWQRSIEGHAKVWASVA
jgi:glycosyltransferase involved in cell wall biosynthesis